MNTRTCNRVRSMPVCSSVCPAESVPRLPWHTINTRCRWKAHTHARTLQHRQNRKLSVCLCEMVNCTPTKKYNKNAFRSHSERIGRVVFKAVTAVTDRSSYSHSISLSFTRSIYDVTYFPHDFPACSRIWKRASFMLHFITQCRVTLWLVVLCCVVFLWSKRSFRFFLIYMCTNRQIQTYFTVL